MEFVRGVRNDARLIHASFKAPPSMVGVKMGQNITYQPYLKSKEPRSGCKT